MVHLRILYYKKKKKEEITIVFSLLASSDMACKLGEITH